MFSPFIPLVDVNCVGQETVCTAREGWRVQQWADSRKPLVQSSLLTMRCTIWSHHYGACVHGWFASLVYEKSGYQNRQIEEANIPAAVSSLYKHSFLYLNTSFLFRLMPLLTRTSIHCVPFPIGYRKLVHCHSDSTVWVFCEEKKYIFWWIPRFVP